jgi:hypothetical protein
MLLRDTEVGVVSGALTGLTCYYAAFFAFAQRAFCAAEIRARAAADKVCFFGLTDLFAGLCFVAVPFNSLLTCFRRAISRFRKFGQRDKWKGCSPTAIKMAEMRSNDDATFTPEPHIGL